MVSFRECCERFTAAALAFRAALDETIDLLQNGENALPHTRDAVSGGLRSPALNSAAGLCTDYRPTRREAEVLALTAEGWTNQQIGRRLGIAERTVIKHLEAVYDKAGVRGRAAAAVWWQRLNG